MSSVPRRRLGSPSPPSPKTPLHDRRRRRSGREGITRWVAVASSTEEFVHNILVGAPPINEHGKRSEIVADSRLIMEGRSMRGGAIRERSMEAQRVDRHPPHHAEQGRESGQQSVIKRLRVSSESRTGPWFAHSTLLSTHPSPCRAQKRESWSPLVDAFQKGRAHHRECAWGAWTP